MPELFISLAQMRDRLAQSRCFDPLVEMPHCLDDRFYSFLPQVFRHTTGKVCRSSFKGLEL
jgi:hypothetical protein